MKDICRLCMTPEIDLIEMDSERNLTKKISSCINIQVHPEDDLPSVICKICENKINMFYNFKQNCLNVDIKLRTLIYSSKIEANTNLNSVHITTDMDLQCDLYQTNCNKLNQRKNATEHKEDSHDTDRTSPKESRNNAQVGLMCKDSYKSQTSNRFQCELCGQVFKIKACLENHLLKHSGLKPYPCKMCSKRFCRAENAIVHMRSHLGIRPFICEICGRSSTKRQDLFRHMKIHSDERNYACSLCGRQFKRSSDVASHMRTHSGIRPYGCHKCNKNYTSHSGLRKHLKAHCKKEHICGK